MISTIQINKETKEKIEQFKNKGETYEEVILKMLALAKKDEFKGLTKPNKEEEKLDKLHKKYFQTREEIASKFKKEKLSEIQIEIKMNSIDMDFFRHLWINGKDFTKNNNEARIKFYIEYLELELKNN